MPTVTCPHCEAELEVPHKLMGKKINCPECENEFFAKKDEEPTLRRHLPVVAIIGICTVLVFGCICAFIVLIAKSSSHNESPSDGVRNLSHKDILDMADHPEHFKGMTVRCQVMLDSSIRQEDGDDLSKWANREVVCSAIVPNKMVVRVTIKMPAQATDIPKAHVVDSLVITWKCSEGRLDRGNEAVKVTRP